LLDDMQIDPAGDGAAAVTQAAVWTASSWLPSGFCTKGRTGLSFGTADDGAAVGLTLYM
jgi:hypothetical protein